mgnify:CR=1 FL=1
MEPSPERPSSASAVLPDLWYYALPSRWLKPGRMVAKTLLGQPLLFARTTDGEAFALVDICPHRGIPLRYGRFDGNEVECCYHGWRFDRAGRCTLIPSLVEGQDFDPGRIKARRVKLAERQGNIWIFSGREDAADTIAVPELPAIGAAGARIVERVLFPCHVDHAVVGLMDPAHGPFVHRSWWWRRASSIHAKEKRYAASELGFSMVRHPPSRNSALYRILGGGLSTEIAFRLPGVRIEHIQAGRYTLVGLTTVTPIDETQTELHHLIYWTAPWLTPMRALLRPVARTFLNQDRDIVIKQQDGLRHAPALMLINDADVPAKWYYRLRREWASSRAERRTFVNPVPAETLLRWRS